MEEENRGISAIKKWLEDHKISGNKFAIKNGLDPSEFSKLLRKKKLSRLSIDTAVKIERGTGGEVKAELFASEEGS